MEIGEKKGFITVVAPLSGSPAEKAGMKAGDMMLATQFYEKVLEMDPKSENAKHQSGNAKKKPPGFLSHPGCEESCAT